MYDRLFVAGGSPDAKAAIANLEGLHSKDERSDVQIEIVDVQRDPARAARDGIMLTPTLLKVFPTPGCRLLGNLKNREALLDLLGMERRPDSNEASRRATGRK